jgi:zinc protease
MSRRFYPLFVVLMFLSAPCFAAGKTFNAETFTMKNGMQVVVIPNHRAPVVTHMVWYKQGAADEPAGVSGIAHFLEHLMFKGTKKIPAGEFSKRVKAMGGNDNAFTSQDYTAYHQSIAVERLETVMQMEADRMRGLTLPEKDVDSERLVIIEERRMRIDNDPAAKLSEQINDVLFVNHPYRDPIIGWEHEMAKLSRADAKAFYDAWYEPNNAILIVSGDITAAKLKPMAEKIYGSIKSRKTPQRERTKIPPLPAAVMLTMHDESVRQPQWERTYRVPSLHQNKADSLAFDVLESIMDGGSAARLYKALVFEQKVATGVSLSYHGAAWDDGSISISATPSDGKTPDDVAKAVDAELRRLIKDGVTEAEMTEAKARMQDVAALARDSLTGPAMIFGQTLTTGGTVDDVELWADNVAAVTSAQVQDVAKRFLNPDDFAGNPPVTGILLPVEK